MERHCSVVDCPTGKSTVAHNASLFGVPTNLEERQKWSHILGVNLTNASLVCEKHFRPQDMKSSEIVYDKNNGQVIYEYQFKEKVLIAGAQPCSFIQRSQACAFPQRAQSSTYVQPERSVEQPPVRKKMRTIQSEIENVQEILIRQELEGSPEMLSINFDRSVNKGTSSKRNSFRKQQHEIKTLFDMIIYQRNSIKLPTFAWNHHYCEEEKIIVFSQLQLLPSEFGNRSMIPSYFKQVILDTQSNLEVHFLKRRMELPILLNIPKTVKEFEYLLTEIHNIPICVGGPKVKCFKNIQTDLAYKDQGNWRHKQCKIAIQAGKICTLCLSLYNNLSHHTNYPNLSKY